MKHYLLTLLLLLICAAPTFAQTTAPAPFIRGVDLSYVNEMDDCGAVYRVDGEPRDAYAIFADNGANLVRLRLWKNPDWTDYSTLDDVIRASQRAKALGMGVLLDFHYSDTWADPGKQIIPAVWAQIGDLDALGHTLYEYTYDVLTELDARGLMPAVVQVGNEINSEILRAEDSAGYPIDWERNGYLLNQAIQAVRDAGAQAEQAPRLMLHIAKPEEVEGWMLAAQRAGVTDFDIIGISYYPGWSRHSVETAGNVIRKLRYQFGKDVLIAETAYPWTLGGAPDAGNILNETNLLPDYPATPEGQRAFVIDLMQTVLNNGGLGIVYWEPAWVSTDCRTLWGQGSHWDNAAFFDFRNENEVLPAIEFLSHDYQYPVDVTLRYTWEDADAPEQIYLWGDFTGMGRRPLALTGVDGVYTLHTRLQPGTLIHYQFYGALPATPATMLIPGVCADVDGMVWLDVPESGAVVEHTADGGCP